MAASASFDCCNFVGFYLKKIVKVVPGVPPVAVLARPWTKSLLIKPALIIPQRVAAAISLLTWNVCRLRASVSVSVRFISELTVGKFQWTCPRFNYSFCVSKLGNSDSQKCSANWIHVYFKILFLLNANSEAKKSCTDTESDGFVTHECFVSLTVVSKVIRPILHVHLQRTL